MHARHGAPVPRPPGPAFDWEAVRRQVLIHQVRPQPRPESVWIPPASAEYTEFLGNDAPPQDDEILDEELEAAFLVTGEMGNIISREGIVVSMLNPEVQFAPEDLSMAAERAVADLNAAGNTPTDVPSEEEGIIKRETLRRRSPYQSDEYE